MPHQRMSGMLPNPALKAASALGAILNLDTPVGRERQCGLEALTGTAA